MISLSTQTYDINGYVMLDVIPTNLFDARRRGSVTATLDGGVSVYDSGYSVADQTIKCQVNAPSKSLLEQLQYIVSHYGQIVVCCEAGAFLCIPSLENTKNNAMLSFRLIRRLN
jgi:hypothetical protein